METTTDPAKTRQQCVEQLRLFMTFMTDEERLSLWAELMKGYCRECGSVHLPCYCMRDD